MKRKRLALLLALAMTVTSFPANTLIVSAAEEADGFVAGDEASAEVESSEDAADGFAVGDAVLTEGEDGMDVFESSEDGFTSAAGVTGAETGFQAEEQEDTAEMVSPESIETNYKTDHWPDVKLYDRVELTSEAYSTDGTKLTYQWYESDKDKGSGDKVLIEGATSSVFVIESAVQSKSYYCVATDAEGNFQEEQYGVTVKTIAFERAKDQEENYENISVKAHGQAILKSAAYSLLGNNLKYQWKKWNAEKNDYEVIEGADQATYVVNDVAANGTYCCWISDADYECDEYFYVKADAGLRYADEEEDNFWINAEIGESLTLKTTVIADEGVALKYQWFKLQSQGESDEYVEIPGETRSELTTGALSKKEEYDCKVSDPYGNSLNQSFNITLRNTLQIEGSDKQVIEAEPNGTVELKVSASSKLTDELTYQWYIQSNDGADDVEIEENKNKSSLKIENITKNANYYCRIYDGNEYKYVNFMIEIVTGLNVKYGAGGSDFMVDYGKSVTMETVATANPGIKLNYQWYVIDDNWEEQLISGANQKSYTIDKAEASKTYECKVTDNYGNKVNLEFYIEVRRIVVNNTYMMTYAEAGEDAELIVYADSVIGEKLTYQWYKKSKEEKEYTLLEGEKSNILTVKNVQADAEYYCAVQDSQITKKVGFYLAVDTCIILKNQENNITGKVGSKVVLNSEAFVETGVNLTYQWYKAIVKYDEEGEDYYDYQIVKGATSAMYEVTVSQEDEQYMCKVEASNGNAVKNYFYVSKASVLSGGESKYVSVNPGENTTLKTDITGEAGKKLTYQWFCENEGENIALDDANAESYEIKNAAKSMEYYCLVSCGDETERQYFYVEVVSGLTLNSADHNSLNVKSGTENVKLEVSAKSSYDLSYEWYKYSENEDTLDVEWIKLDGADRNTYLINRATEQWSYYRCKVSDKYNSAFVYFNINIYPDIVVNAEENVWVSKGAAATLSVHTTAGAGCEKINYKWYRYIPYGNKGGWSEIQDAVKETYTTTAVDALQRYRCEVSDQNGSSIDVYILVGPENLKKKTAVYFEDAIAVTPGTRCRVSTEFPDMYKIYKIVPDRSGIWQIRSISSKTRISAYLYDEQQKLLAESEVQNKYFSDFDIQYNLEKGKTYYLKCARNDNYGRRAFLIEANFVKEEVHEHKWDAGVAKTAATCAKAGTKVYTCETCRQTKEEAIPATGKHSFGEYTVTKAPTVLAAGVKTRTCKVCGKTETAAVAKLNGTIKVVSAKVPLQLKKKVALSKLVTGLTTGDSINAAACTSSKPSIAAISGGNVVAKKAGTTVVTVKLASGVSAQVTVVVQKKAVATSSIKGVPSTVNLTVGDKLQLKPVVRPVTSLNKVSYTSTNKKIATVSKTGVIKAKKSGTVTIKVKSGKKTKNIKVKVAKKAPIGMTGVPATKTLKKGKSFTIKAKLTPSGAEAKIKYSSSNKKIATVNGKGKVTAKKTGTVTITVKAGNVTKTCVVTVKK